MLTKQQKQQIEATLKRKGAWKDCSKCGHNQFHIDGYFHHEVQPSATPTASPTVTTVPSIGLLCEHCGHLDFFAVRSVLPHDSQI